MPQVYLKKPIKGWQIPEEDAAGEYGLPIRMRRMRDVTKCKIKE
jgi:hypothetical protein